MFSARFRRSVRTKARIRMKRSKPATTVVRIYTVESYIPALRVTFFARTSIFMPTMKFQKVGIFTNTAGRNCKVFSINRFRFAVIVITQCIRNRFPGKSPSEKRRSGCRWRTQVRFCEFFGTILRPKNKKQLQVILSVFLVKVKHEMLFYPV